MKSLSEIQNQAEKGDKRIVARLTNVSLSLVKMVLRGEREDYYGIQKVASDLIEAREKLAAREKNKRINRAIRESKRIAA